MSNEDWRFEADTYLMQAMLYHYDSPHRTCLHNDELICARAILKWLEEHGAVLKLSRA